jgi:uncharacterized SAM-binding protein YcdF (DUF218 family)
MYHFLSKLSQPPLLLYLLTGLALAILWRKRQSKGRLIWVTSAFLVLMLLCLPAVNYVALGTLEWRYPPLDERPADVEAIVVLAGYVYRPDGTRSQAELGEDSLYRCLKAADLYHQGTPCPVLVSGGKVDPDAPGPTCAAVMRDFLAKLGVSASDLVVEDRSRTTHENAVESSRLLAQRDIHRVVLVTDAPHLLRALGCFRKQGIDAVPCGCRYRATHFDPSPLSFVPNPSEAEGCEVAWHEWVGTAWYWMWGRL